MRVHSHEDLHVWQFALRLAADVDAIASRLPDRERFGLAAQMRRAAASIPSNIAEGSPRPTRSYIYHLRIARGSEAELKTQLDLAVRAGLLAPSEVAPAQALASQVGRMLNGLIKSLQEHLRETDP